MFMPFTVTQGTMVHFMTVFLTLWVRCNQLIIRRMQSVDVSDANAHHSEWLESVSPTDRHRHEALDFCNPSGCEQLVRCPTHIAGNRLDLVMTDVPDIIDAVVCTSLGTSDHCFVSCVLRVEQVCARAQFQKYGLSKASYPLRQCPQCSQELYMERHFEVS